MYLAGIRSITIDKTWKRLIAKIVIADSVQEVVEVCGYVIVLRLALKEPFTLLSSFDRNTVAMLRHDSYLLMLPTHSTRWTEFVCYTKSCTDGQAAHTLSSTTTAISQSCYAFLLPNPCISSPRKESHNEPTTMLMYSIGTFWIIHLLFWKWPSRLEGSQGWDKSLDPWSFTN